MGAIIVPECSKGKLYWMTFNYLAPDWRVFPFWHGCCTRGGPHDAVTPSGGVFAHLGTFLRVSPPAWECYCSRGDFLGNNSCPQVSSHLPWERICLPLAPCTRLPWAWPSSWVVSVPKASLGRQGYFTSQAALPWCYHYGLEATFSFSLSLSRAIGTWGLPTVSRPPWSFLPMGIGEPHCDCLVFTLFHLATP